MKKIQIEKKGSAIFRVKLLDFKSASEAKFLCVSDAHIDNSQADLKLLKSHLEEAKKTSAYILLNGDTFCAMQGKWDKRADQTQLRPELQGNNYLDRLVKYVADFLMPYASQILVIGQGNHETSILKHHQTNLLDRLIHELRRDKGCEAQLGGYSTWIQFAAVKPSNQPRSVKNMLMYHGCGGGAFVTKGSIDMNRIGIGFPDADIIWIGHKHNEFCRTEPRYRLNSHGTEYQDEQLGFMTPGYKVHDESKTGWEIERLPNPKPTGAAWLTFFLDTKAMLRYEHSRAK